MFAAHCRHCRRAAGGADPVQLGAGELSFASVAVGHTPQTLLALAARLEERLVAGVSVWCP
eukprot:2769174-Rhodomonas_salina.1